MKNISKALTRIALAAVLSSSVLVFGGCSDNEESSAPVETESVAEQETTASSEEQGEFDIKDLQYYDTDSTSSFAGAWKITDGVGSDYSSFVYIFDGNGKATLVVGNTGYCGSYSLTIDEEVNDIEIFECNLMFGINGEYTFKFSESKDTLYLTYRDGDAASTLEKLSDDYTFVPTAPENPVIDDELIGAWASDNGIYYYFGADGIMYANSYETMFTYYTYSAKDGEITAVYDMNGEITETYEYSFDGEILTFDGIEYSKIPTSKLR